MAEMLSGVSDTIMNGLQSVLYATVYKFLYYLAVGCCWVIDLLYSMFEIMAGLSKVSYDGDYDYLINIFFANTTVSKIYWGLALIGLTVGFGLAIVAVIKKMFDINDKEKRSYGQILGALFRSFLTILCMSLIITMVINATTLLMQQINYVFINADDLGEEKAITYTDEEYAAMARALNTIGNFSLNPSYNNRYNLNKCFNEVRLDLQYLKQQGVFDFHYVTKDVEGNTIATWQSALQKIANSASLDRDLNLDVYHESVSNAILQAMDLLKVNGSFKPLEEYQRHYQPSRNGVPMDRFLFLMASMRAAKNADYNINPSLTDPLRGAYYYGEKSIYDLDTVNEDFDIGIAALDYFVLFLTCFKMLETLATVILNCVGRIFNMLLLYLISPIIIAIFPLDDGAKFKQWTTAFIVQSFSVFGTVISMRVFLLFMPIVVDPKLVLFENPIANLLTKLVIVLGAFEVSEKATSLITGILADNAGWQSITAGDMSGTAKSVVAKGKALAMSYGASGLNMVKGAGGMGLSALGMGAKAGLKGAAGVGLGVGYGAYFAGKGAVAGTKALASKISAWRNGGGGAAGGGTGGEKGGGEKGSGEKGGGATGSGEGGGGDTGSESHRGVGNESESFAPETKTGFEGFGTTAPGQQSLKIAAMARAVDAHNQGGGSPQAVKSPKIAAMAKAVDAHNLGTASPQGAQSSQGSLMTGGVDTPNQGVTSPQGAQSSQGSSMTGAAGAPGQGAASPQVAQSPKIAAMARAVDAQNLGTASPQGARSSQGSSMSGAAGAPGQGVASPQVAQSPKIAAMARAVDAHNLGTASPQEAQSTQGSAMTGGVDTPNQGAFTQSPKIAAMARAVDAHNLGTASPQGTQSAQGSTMAGAVDAPNQGTTSPRVTQSLGTATVAGAVDAHNRGEDSPQAVKSSRIEAMAQAFDAHNQNPQQQTPDPYEAGQAASQRPVKSPPVTVVQRQKRS